MLSQQFWWHHTALFPKSGNLSKRALGADILSMEYPALILPKVRGIIEASTTNIDRQRLQANIICIRKTNNIDLTDKNHLLWLK